MNYSRNGLQKNVDNENVLRKLSGTDQSAGADAKGIISGTVITVSLAICPTTKCTSRC